MSDSNTPSVIYRATNGVATITLNRPEVLNAMNTQLMRELGKALDEGAADTSVRVVVLGGEGRGFCAGADLTAARSNSKTNDSRGSSPPAPNPVDVAIADMDEIYNPTIRRLTSMPVPTVARLHGVAAGGGLGLVLGCDIVVAARSASLVSTFGPRMGIVPDMGSSWHLPHLVGRARALGMAMLGERISAEQAADWGLIWAAVPDDQLDDAVQEVVERLRQSSSDAMARTRQVIDEASGRSLGEQLDVETEHQRHLIPRNMIRAAQAFLAKREPEFDR